MERHEKNIFSCSVLCYQRKDEVILIKIEVNRWNENDAHVADSFILLLLHLFFSYSCKNENEGNEWCCLWMNVMKLEWGGVRL